MVLSHGSQEGFASAWGPLKGIFFIWEEVLRPV